MDYCFYNLYSASLMSNQCNLKFNTYSLPSPHFIWHIIVFAFFPSLNWHFSRAILLPHPKTITTSNSHVTSIDITLLLPKQPDCSCKRLEVGYAQSLVQQFHIPITSTVVHMCYFYLFTINSQGPCLECSHHLEEEEGQGKKYTFKHGKDERRGK